MHFRTKVINCVYCFALTTLAGCGGGAADGPTLYPVSGKLTNGDKPLANVTITFVPTDEGKPSSIGTTGDDGTFSLRSMQGGEGAVSGKHKVVLAMEVAEESYTNPEAGDPGRNAPPPFPESYLSAETTPKEVTVDAGDNNIVIDVGQ